MFKPYAHRLVFVLVAAIAMCAIALPSFAGEYPQYEPNANDSRDQVPDVYKWDLTPLFASVEDWEKALEDLSAEVEVLESYKGKLSDPKAMAACLDLYFDVHNRTSHVQQYAALALETNLTDEEKQARHRRALTLMDDVMTAAGFMRGEILALDDAAMEQAYAAPEGPGKYRRYLDDLRRRRGRVLHPEAERVLQLAGDNLWAEIDLNEIQSSVERAFGALMSDISWPMVHDEDGNEVQLALANYPRFRRSPNREVRAEAVAAFFGTLRQFQHVFAQTLGGQFELDVTYARARHYDTAIEAYMDKDNLDTAVHDNLLSAVNANLKPLHRYVELRKKVMGFDDLHIYDLYVPMVEAAQMDITYEEAERMLPKALAPLGEEYVEILDEGLDLENGWIDLYPSNDKDSGAFSASVYGRAPYVKMNYQNSHNDLATLAHEFGHAIHSYMAMESQAYPDFRYVPFLAEIASTCNEALLQDYLVANAESKEEKIGLLVEELESIRTTIYRQTLFTEFERVVHGYVEEGTPITASLLDETYRELVQRYYGPGFTVDENDGMEWAYIPHFYYKYYVYSYATGLSCGLAIAERVKELGEPAVQDYFTMLEGGCSKPPLELLKGAGVDLTGPEAIEAALKRFDRTLTELAALLEVDI
jgi:oligoendopeptidase F